MTELYNCAKQAQIPRNGIIHLLADPSIGTILRGSYVRVLLELQDHSESYLLARVDGIDRGEPYTGFSQVPTQSTDILLKLQLPSALTGINGLLYQLNSISNSAMSVEEFERWKGMIVPEFPLPTEQELLVIAETIRPYTARRGQQQQNAAQPVAGTLANQPSMVARANLGATELNVTRKEKTHASPRSADDDLPTRSQVHHQILNELRDKNALFPVNIDEMKATNLRLAERDLNDYLESVRAAISSKRSICVVCMDQVATVIMLPCKHKVLCRLCAPNVNNCPCCRELATELFEPVEI